MINKIFSMASFTLLVWLAVTLVTASQQLVNLQHELETKIDSTHKILVEHIAELKRASDFPQNQHLTAVYPKRQQSPGEESTLTKSNSEPDDTNLRPKEKNAFNDLQIAHKRILETEIEKDSHAIGAAEKLLSTKEPIWRASTQHESVKTALQSLMAPIDILAAQWRRGETTGSAKPVADVVHSSLASLNNQYGQDSDGR